MHITVLLFDNYETLDVFGPVEILGRLPEHFKISYYSLDGLPKTSTQGVRIETLKLASLADKVDILLIPGGKGTRTGVDNKELIEAIKELSEQATYVLTVCTGSALLARTGLLDGRRATSNKRAFEWVVSQGKEVDWKRKARWVVDGKYYTSSGISAGIDMALGFVSDLLGRETAVRIANETEYRWNSDPDEDDFT